MHLKKNTKLTLIKSISGIRGTIGGMVGTNLTPIDIVECSAGFGEWLKKSTEKPKVVIGRDGRISGKMVARLVSNTLVGMGIDVVDLGLSTTPTVEIAVPYLNANGGIIITASHNPKQWNALKFVDHQGEFISASTGKTILKIINDRELTFAEVNNLGNYSKRKDLIDIHIGKILDLNILDIDKIKQKRFKIVVDCINSTGAISVPPLLEKLGCEVFLINDEITGDFAHNPEPRPAHLKELAEKTKEKDADLGISIDPDVDRLAFVCEDGSMFGEEYTLVAVADAILSIKKGNTVSNLSSTRALADITKKYGGEYKTSAVGEVNVVSMMKKTNAIIGGEGNGGVILPELHYGRDALVGIAMILNVLAERNISLSRLRATYPEYVIVKNKINLEESIDVQDILSKVAMHYKSEKVDTTDGVKVDFQHGWVHIRKSNTEPIIRVYSEAKNEKEAQKLAKDMMNLVDRIVK